MVVDILSVRATNKDNNIMRICFSVDGEIKALEADCTKTPPYQLIKNYLFENDCNQELDIEYYEEGTLYSYDKDFISRQFGKLTNYRDSGIGIKAVRDLIYKLTE